MQANPNPHLSMDLQIEEEDDFLRATRELKEAKKFYEQLPASDETRKMYRPLVDITKMNMKLIYPFKVTADAYFKGEMADFSVIHQMFFAFYGTVLRRRYKNDPKVAHFMEAMSRCAELKDQGKEIMTDTDYSRFDKTLFFKGLDILCKTKVVPNAVLHNGAKLYPIRLFNTECRTNLLYWALETECPDLLRLAKKLRKDIYLTEGFNFVVGDWVEEYIDQIKFPNPRVSESYELAANLKLSIIKIS